MPVFRTLSCEDGGSYKDNGCYEERSSEIANIEEAASEKTW